MCSSLHFEVNTTVTVFELSAHAYNTTLFCLINVSECNSGNVAEI
jgi:hypothetical protein